MANKNMIWIFMSILLAILKTKETKKHSCKYGTHGRQEQSCVENIQRGQNLGVETV